MSRSVVVEQNKSRQQFKTFDEELLKHSRKHGCVTS